MGWDAMLMDAALHDSNNTNLPYIGANRRGDTKDRLDPCPISTTPQNASSYSY